MQYNLKKNLRILCKNGVWIDYVPSVLYKVYFLISNLQVRFISEMRHLFTFGEWQKYQCACNPCKGRCYGASELRSSIANMYGINLTPREMCTEIALWNIISVAHSGSISLASVGVNLTKRRVFMRTFRKGVVCARTAMRLPAGCLCCRSMIWPEVIANNYIAVAL